MKKICIYSVVALLLSCASESEEKAALIVAQNYETVATFSKEFISEKGEAKPIYYIKLEPNTLLDTINMDYAASNMGLLIYENLSKEELEEYDRFQIETKNKGKDFSQAYGFNDEMSNTISKAKLFDNFSQHIVDEEYKLADDIVTPANRGDDQGEILKNYIQEFVGQNGKVSHYKRTGYGTNNAETIWQFTGYLVFNSGNTLSYLIVTSKDKEDQHIIGYRFD